MKLLFNLLMIFFFILPSLLFAASPWGKILICYSPSQKYPMGGYFRPEPPEMLVEPVSFRLSHITRRHDKYRIYQETLDLRMNIEEIVLGDFAKGRLFEEEYWLDRKTLQLRTLNPEINYNCEILNYDHSPPKDITDPKNLYYYLENTIISTLEKRMQHEVEKFQLEYDLAREKKGNKL